MLTIADDGPGIPREQWTRVFDRFVRLDASRARDAGGSGLGLAIVAEIVAAHRGTVEVGDRDGGGACITVTCRPTPTATSPPREPVADTADGVNRARSEGNVDFPAQVPDVNLDDIVVALVVDVPHRPESPAWSPPPGVAHEELQHPVLARCQLYFDAAAGNEVSRRVQHEVIDGENRRARGGPPA